MKTSNFAKFVIVLLALLFLAPAGFAETSSQKSSPKKDSAKKETSAKKADSKDEPKKEESKPAAIIAPVSETAPAAPVNGAEPMGPEDKIAFMQTDSVQPQSSEGISTGGLIIKTLGAMLLIVGLLFFGAWGLKKTGFGGLKSATPADAPELTIVSSVTVGNGRTISTVKFGNRTLLVGSTAQSFTLLADGPEDDSFSHTAAPRSVADMLAAEEAEESFNKEFMNADALLAEWRGGQA
jgi:flagellar biogenesis protein FliO